MRAPATRELCIFAKQFSSSVDNHLAAVSDIWLDSLKLFGLIALKLFLFTITKSTRTVRNQAGQHFTATTTYVTSAVQSILIGAEDVLWSSPLVETEDRKKDDTIYKVPCIDYQQAKMSSATIRITGGSALQSRAGRFVACIVDLSEEELSRYIPANETQPPSQPDAWTFQDVIQMAGAVTAPFGTPITLVWRAKPATYAYRFLGIGQTRIEDVDWTKNLQGGRPCFRLVIGYQDYASNSGAVSDLYSPSEALVHIDIRGHVQLKESGRRYIRSWPLTTMNSSNASVLDSETRAVQEVPIENFATNEIGQVFLMKPISLEGMVLE